MKVLGMGNALVDIMTSLTDEKILEKFSMAKGSMQLIDKDFVGKLLAEAADLEQQLSSGGSASNTIHGLARLGVDSAYIGKIGDDDFGGFFKTDLEKHEVKPLLFTGKEETGRAIALVTPDSERTFGTYLGAAIELTKDDIDSDLFEGYDYFHIEGYLVQNQELIGAAMKMAHDKGVKISIDMASFNVVEDNRDFLKEIINKHVDIVFANEDEAKALTGQEPGEALEKIAEMCEIAVVKLGEKGSMIKYKGNVYKVGIVPSKSIDTTGAGDLYAAGFIYGLVKGHEIQKCGEIGALLAGKVIEVMGAKIDDNRWNIIESVLNKF
jgi:sugar/nucleoside kinase (ribokinase family)